MQKFSKECHKMTYTYTFKFIRKPKVVIHREPKLPYRSKRLQKPIDGLTVPNAMPKDLLLVQY